MIFCSRLDGLGSVKLLERHHARKVVRKRHVAHGEKNIRLLFQPRIHAERRADQKADARSAAFFDIGKLSRQFLGREHLSFGRKHAEKASLRNLCANQLCLPGKPLRNLRGVRVLRQLILRQLQQLKRAERPQPFFVLLRRGNIKLLLELPHTNERH